MDPLRRLHDAVERMDAAGVAWALAAGAPVDGLEDWDPSGMTPLNKAALMGSCGCACLLLNAGADANSQTHLNGLRPLHIAAAGGHAPLISLLLAAGADPLAANDSQAVPLHCAVTAGGIDAVRALVEAAPEAAAIAAGDETPFGYTLRVRDLEAARCLLAGGAPPMEASQMLTLLRSCGQWAQPLYATLAAR